MAKLATQYIHGGWIEYGTVVVDPASLATGAENTTSLTITGVKAGDHVLSMTPPSALEAGLILKGASVTAANTVGVTVRNASGGTVDGAALTWKYAILHVS